MAQKMEAKGGKGGKEWNDSADNENVAKIHVRGGPEGVQFIKIDYVKNGQVQNGSIHGVSGKGFTQTFDIDYLTNEYLASVECYYDEATGVIQGIRFKTNLNTSELMGSDLGTKFSLRVPGKRIIGFHGFAETNLNSLGAYFTKVPPTKLPLRGNLGAAYEVNWDDGGDYDGVLNVYVSYNSNKQYFNHIAFDYDKGGQVVTREHIWLSKKGSVEGKFAVDYPNDYITAVEVTVGQHGAKNYTGITSLTFRTSKGIISPTYGTPLGRIYVLENGGNPILGFYGRVGAILDNIGAYCDSNVVAVMEAQGGKGGKEWDDFADHDDVAKVRVRGGTEGIQFINFDYAKNGQVQNGPIHGLSGKGFTETFEIKYLNNEYLQSVEGYYDEASGVIQGIKFKTNLNTSGLMGSDFGTKFSLAILGQKIIGFHGFAETNLNSLGAYFNKIPPTKLPYEGADNEANWDDGGDHDGVLNVYLSYNPNYYFHHIAFDYNKGGQVVTREHIWLSNKGSIQQKFTVDYPNDYITSVEGTVGQHGANNYTGITSLIFKTSKGITSPIYGYQVGRKFVIESKGNALVGFYGRIGVILDNIGVYCGPPPLRSLPAEKLQGKGGEGGSPWDDGYFDGVKKIYVGQGENGVAAVKFVYNKDYEVVEGDEHGKATRHGYEEFELDYPSEYITAVEGTYDKILGSENGVITMLKFKTNKKTSPPFGLEGSTEFVIEKEGYKIVGFHGRASHELSQLGVHVVPITQ